MGGPALARHDVGVKTPTLLRAAVVFLTLLALPLAFGKPPAITYAGGDGSSIEKAVVINGATEETGVHAEYEYLARQHPGYKRGGQSLQSHNGKAYDVLEFTTADGKKSTIYFDISAFFGK